jgi:putative molybdopterin biosynthesis protein
MDSRALTPQEVADRLRVAKNTVYELIKRGELRGYRVGNQVRVDESALEEYRGTQTAAPFAAAAPFVLAGQDVLLDLLAQRVGEHLAGTRVLRSAAGSYAGLSGLYLGTVNATSTHLWNAEHDRYNVDFIQALVPGIATVRFRLVTRRVGWYVAPGNPLGLHGWEALDAGRTLANRERGSGIRVLLDGRLSRRGSPVPAGYEREYPSHLAVASAVARGDADFGLGNEKTAMASGVEFIPLQTEEVDLVLKRSELDQAPVPALLEVLRSAAFHQELEGLGGYGLDLLGTELSSTDRN